MLWCPMLPIVNSRTSSTTMASEGVQNHIKTPSSTTFTDIQGGMATQQRSLQVLPQTPPHNGKNLRKSRILILKGPNHTTVSEANVVKGWFCCGGAAAYLTCLYVGNLLSSLPALLSNSSGAHSEDLSENATLARRPILGSSV